MRRAFPIIILLLIPWIVACTVPSVADEFKYRDFGFTSYPGWSDRHLILWGAGLATLSLGSMLGGLILFQRRPPPLYWPRALTWWIAFLTFSAWIASALWHHQLVNLMAYFAGLGLWYLFLSDRMRFWGAEVR